MKINNYYKDINIGFEITRNCNMRCPYCYVVNRQHEGEELGKEDWLELSRVIVKCLPGYDISVNLAGGEIFVKDWTIDIINYLLQAGVYVKIGTNGLEIPEALMKDESLRNNRLLSIGVSMDGTKDVHEITRLDFDRVMRNVNNLLEKGINVALNATVHKKNLEHILELCVHINELGKSYDSIIRFNVQPMLIGPLSEIRVEIKDYQKLKLSLQEYLRKGLFVLDYVESNLKFVENRWRFISEMLNDDVRGKKMCLESALFGCSTGYGFEVMANGDVMACEMDVPMINIKDNISESILEQVLDLLEKKLVPNRRCIECTYKLNCGMCRLMPLMHGYTEGFGYEDCQLLMHDVLDMVVR